MANVPIAGVSYHHDGLPKPLSVHCLGQGFNKASIQQRFAPRCIANIAQNNMSPQSIRYIGIQPCMQHIHSSSPYVFSNNIPRKFLNGMLNQPNVWHGTGGEALGGVSQGNMGGNSFSYGNISGNGLPGNMSRNMSSGNISCTFRPGNMISNVSAGAGGGGNNSNMYSNDVQTFPIDLTSQNVGFDMNGNLLMNQNRNSIVTFNNGQLKINDGQLTFNDGQIILNDGQVKLNGPNSNEQFRLGSQNNDNQFNSNTTNADNRQMRLNINTARSDGQFKLNAATNNIGQIQVNNTQRIDGQFTQNISNHVGHFNGNNSRYKLTHLPLQKVKNHILQDNLSNSSTKTEKKVFNTDSPIDEKQTVPLIPNIQRNLDEQSFVSMNGTNHDKESLHAHRNMNDLPVKFDEEEDDALNFSPTYEPQSNVEFLYKHENEHRASTTRKTLRSPIRPIRNSTGKPWLDQTDLSDALKKVRPSWFKGELDSPKRPKTLDVGDVIDTSKKMKVYDVSERNYSNSFMNHRQYNYNDFTTEHRALLNEGLCNNGSTSNGKNNMLKSYRNQVTSECTKTRDESSSYGEETTKNADSTYLSNASTVTKKKSTIDDVFSISKVKEEEGAEKEFEQSSLYNNDKPTRLNHVKNIIYDNYSTTNEPMERDYNDIADNVHNAMKGNLDTPNISTTFFNDTQKVDSNLDFLDEPPPLIKVEML